MKFSIITTVYNDEDEILRYLDNMMSQSIEANEIVIVDGGSSDNTINIIEQQKFNSKIPIKLYKGRYNIAQGFNQGINQCENDWVGITSVGCIYPVNYFECLFKEISFNNNLDAVYSLIRAAEGTAFSQVYAKYFCNLENGEKKATNRGVVIKKSVIAELGYFYENLFYAGEDEEFYQRFNNYKKKAICCTSTKVYWKVPMGLKEFLKQTRLYSIGYMQVYTNTLVLKMFKGRIKYVGLIFLTILSLLISKFFLVGRMLTLLFILLLSYCNLKWCMKNGLSVCLLKNIYFLSSVFFLVIDCKFLIKKNKICPERLIDSI